MSRTASTHRTIWVWIADPGAAFAMSLHNTVEPLRRRARTDRSIFLSLEINSL
jgi:hypothetical protein